MIKKEQQRSGLTTVTKVYFCGILIYQYTKSE